MFVLYLSRVVLGFYPDTFMLANFPTDNYNDSESVKMAMMDRLSQNTLQTMTIKEAVNPSYVQGCIKFSSRRQTGHIATLILTLISERGYYTGLREPEGHCYSFVVFK